MVLVEFGQAGATEFVLNSASLDVAERLIVDYDPETDAPRDIITQILQLCLPHARLSRPLEEFAQTNNLALHEGAERSAVLE